jgi:hypothetical protein
MTKTPIADDPGSWGWRPKDALQQQDTLPAHLFAVPRRLRIKVYDDESGVHLATVCTQDRMVHMVGSVIVIRLELG